MTEQKTLTYAEILELLKSTIQEREVRFEAMRKRYDEIKQTYNEINPKHSEADKCFSEIKKCRTDMNTLFVEMPQQAAEVKKLLTSLSLHNTTLEKTFSKIEKQYSIMQQHYADTKAQTTEIKGTDVEVANQLQEMRHDIEKNQHNFAVLSSQVGKFIEHEMDPKRFRAAFVKWGYDILQAGKETSFDCRKAGIGEGEIDVLLEGKNIIILVEEKKNLQSSDVSEHINRLKKYQRYIKEVNGDNRQVFGAMCGVEIAPGLEKVTKEKGLFLIRLNGKIVEILTKRENFTPTAWKHDSATESN